MVPYVIEGSGQKERTYDLYSRLLRDRIIFINGVFDDDMAKSVVAQLLFLESIDKDKDIIIYINSPGGIITAAFAIFDTMQYIKPDVSTICVGAASSAASFILSAGAKGKRYALKNSRIMMHQASGGAIGNIQDMKISLNEVDFLNKQLIKEISILTNQPVKKIKRDLSRDNYLSADEAKNYGVIDEVLIDRGIVDVAD